MDPNINQAPQGMPNPNMQGGMMGAGMQAEMQQPAGGMNPGAVPFSGNPNISYEQPAAPEPEPEDEMSKMLKEDPGGVPMNVINAVNANGIVSGEKLVNYIWKQISLYALIGVAAFMIATVVVGVIAININNTLNDVRAENGQKDEKLRMIYNAAGTDNTEETLAKINDLYYVTGGDMDEIHKLLAQKYGAGYQVDFGDHNINFVRKSGGYMLASIGVSRDTGTVRAILYEKIADGTWVMTGFDSTNTEDPCKGVSDDERNILKAMHVCDGAIEDLPEDDGDNDGGGSGSGGETPEEPAEPAEPEEGGDEGKQE